MDREVSSPSPKKIETEIHKQIRAQSSIENLEFAEPVRRKGIDIPHLAEGIAVLIISIVGVALQAWQVYRIEQDRKYKNICPTCHRPEIKKDSLGRSMCAKGHIWYGSRHS